MEIRRGVLNRAKSPVVCNASATNFLLTTDFSGIFGYPNVSNNCYEKIREVFRLCKKFRCFFFLKKLYLLLSRNL